MAADDEQTGNERRVSDSNRKGQGVMTRSNTSDDGRIFQIGRIFVDGVDVGAVYASNVPCWLDTLLAEVEGHRVTLRSRASERDARVELSVTEAFALAAACRAWQSARPGFAPILVRGKRHPHTGRLVEPRDPSTFVVRRSVPARAVEREVMLVAELRTAESCEHAGALAGAVYAMPGDWSLEARNDQAVLMRGRARLNLRPEDVSFVSGLARTLRAQGSKAERATAGLQAEPQAPLRKPATEMTDEESADPFRL
jgi:hypothetical protein